MDENNVIDRKLARDGTVDGDRSCPAIGQSYSPIVAPLCAGLFDNDGGRPMDVIKR